MGATTTGDSWRLRWTVFVAGCLLVILSASGVLVSTLFAQPSTIKYLVTVGAGALVALLALAQAPLKLVVGVAIVVAPFDFVTTFHGIQVTPLIAVDVLAVLLWLPRPSARGTAALRPMTAVLLLLLLPALAGSDRIGGWVVWLALTVATGCLAFVIAREPGGPGFIATMLAVSALVQGALAIWEFRSGNRLNLYQPPGSASYGTGYFFTFGRYDRPPGALPDPVGLGQVLALCIPMMVALGAGVRRWHLSLAVLAATGVAAIALLLSLSRMSIVGAAVGVAVVFLLLPLRTLLRRGAGVAAMVALVAILGLALGGRTVSQRLDSIFHPTASHVATASGDLARIHIWHAALKTGEANLLTGVGFGNVTKHLPKYGVPATPAGHAHDTYLQFFAEGGALGLLALLGILGAAATDLVRGFARHRIWVAGAAGSLVATMLSWLTDVEVRYAQVSAVVAVLLGLIAALAVRERCRSEAVPSTTGDAPERRTMLTELAPAEPPSGGDHAPTLAIVSPSREDGGAERYLRVIAQAAAHRGWHVHAGFPPLPATAALREQLRTMGVRCHSLPLAATQPRSRGEALRLAASQARMTLGLLRHVRPTTVLVVLPHPDQAPGVVLAAALYPAPSVTSVQLVPTGLRFTRGRRLLYSGSRELGQRWLALTADNRRRLAGALGWRQDAIDLIYNGVADDLADSSQDRSQIRREVREELGLPRIAKLIATVGRLNDQKGYDLIADSIPDVVSDHRDAYWVWAGDGPARESLTRRLRLIGAHDRVRMLGFREDVPRLLAAADLFVFPSRYEGAPFAVLEALLSELPVIVSDRGSLPEIVRDGVDGRVVHAEDSPALSHLTAWALDHTAEMSAMAETGRCRVLAEFSREAMVDQTLALLSPSQRRSQPLRGYARRLRRPADSVRPRGPT
jgi:glycosyltransferase involved in cell wall biosynthesis